MPYTTKEIADYIIASAHETGSFLSNLKLQKLLFYAQAWHLAIHDERLLDGHFEAWVHGPVIGDLYREYKKYGWRDIDEKVEKPELDQRSIEFLEDLLDEYGPLDGRRLEWLTHREDPWKNARGELSDDEPRTDYINENDIKTYYRSKMSKDGDRSS